MSGNQLEILSALGGSFTVNTAVKQVAAVLAGTPVFQGTTPPTAQWFDSGDGLLFYSIRCSLPYQFGQGEGQHIIEIMFEDSLGGLHSIPELQSGPGGSRMFMPSACDEINFGPNGLFIPVPTNLPGTGRARLALSFVNLNVSQLNVPALINGVSVQTFYFLTLLHAPEMGLVP
jgi:hypothetical protein